MTWFFRTGFLRGWMETNIWREEEGETNSDDEKEPEKKRQRRKEREREIYSKMSLQIKSNKNTTVRKMPINPKSED
jgi:hypothetical protein